MIRRFVISLFVAVVAISASAVRAQGWEEREIVSESTQVLREIMAMPERGIPRSLLNEAQGLVVVPGMIRGGFIIGVKFGRGIAVARDAEGNWTNPVFVRVTGGNVGFQAGLQATDVVLVFRTRTSVERMLRDQFTIGADASAAAGPVGRNMSAATDVQMRSEILSYSRSRGLFAGVAIGGAVIQPDGRATSAFYGQTPNDPRGTAPEVASRFLRLLNSLSGTPTEVPLVVPQEDRDVVAKQLFAAHQRLMALLDPAWQQFLALPPDLLGTSPTAMENWRQVHARYNSLLNNQQYRSLVDRQEFQETLTLLNRLFHLQEASVSTVITLPPPPK